MTQPPVPSRAILDHFEGVSDPRRGGVDSNKPASGKPGAVHSREQTTSQRTHWESGFKQS